MTEAEERRLCLAEPLVRTQAAVKRVAKGGHERREQWRQRELSDAGLELAEALARLLEGDSNDVGVDTETETGDGADAGSARGDGGDAGSASRSD